MNGVVTTKLVDDGDGAIVTIPEALMKQSGLSEAIEVQIEVRDGTIIVSKIKSPRQGRGKSGVNTSVDQELADWEDVDLL